MYFHGKIKMDESYFGGKKKYKRCRSIKSKISVFDLLIRGAVMTYDH